MAHPPDTQAFKPEYDSDTGTYRVDFDPTERRPSTVVVLAVAAVTETDPLDQAGLHELIDPECLDGLFTPPRDGTPRTDGHVTFSFAGYEVTVDSAGEVVLAPQRA